MFPYGGAYAHVDFGHDHPVVCPAFCTSHGPAHENVFDVTYTQSHLHTHTNTYTHKATYITQSHLHTQTHAENTYTHKATYTHMQNTYTHTPHTHTCINTLMIFKFNSGSSVCVFMFFNEHLGKTRAV